EQLTFAEMYAYLRSELTGLDVQRAKEVVNATEYAEVIFLLAHLRSGRPDERKWRAAMHDLTRSIYKVLNRSLTKTIDLRISELEVKTGATADPWSQKLFPQAESADTDRICSNASLRVIQNTIKAQVEGDLVLLLQPDFPVYP
ncbi:hypothetical protein PHYSODRAFT_440733, partial [Phytophthora sojae]